MPSNVPQAHANYLEHVRNAVASDDRLSALLIGGSYIHGGLDEHSDLDFVIVVNEDSYPDVMATRLAFANALPDLVNAFTGEHVGEPRLLICLYGPPLLHIDLKFVLKSDFYHQIERRAILFARNPAETEALV
ncbi:nucleotidyltransferase domain-containing protein [Pararhizobium arenae]|uniref:nucleotidyltransferase domain-containing protein n=1 Tax=Pararhizobium arenae TaxID=1856850 RepID=UPI000B2D05B4|nr:nucleotidyltransferase domain-containing protein [Pararhizobium arenae]